MAGCARPYGQAFFPERRVRRGCGCCHGRDCLYREARMSWSGSSTLAVVRDGMWGLLMFAGVAWLAVALSVLRLEPADVGHVAGPVILFGALAEAVRAGAGGR